MKYFIEEKHGIALTEECKRILKEIREEIRESDDPATALYCVIDELVQHVLSADIVLALETVKHDVLSAISRRVQASYFLRYEEV